MFQYNSNEDRKYRRDFTKVLMEQSLRTAGAITVAILIFLGLYVGVLLLGA